MFGDIAVAPLVSIRKKRQNRIVKRRPNLEGEKKRENYFVKKKGEFKLYPFFSLSHFIHFVPSWCISLRWHCKTCIKQTNNEQGMLKMKIKLNLRTACLFPQRYMNANIFILWHANNNRDQQNLKQIFLQWGFIFPAGVRLSRLHQVGADAPTAMQFPHRCWHTRKNDTLKKWKINIKSNMAPTSIMCMI